MLNFLSLRWKIVHNSHVPIIFTNHKFDIYKLPFVNMDIIEVQNDWKMVGLNFTTEIIINTLFLTLVSHCRSEISLDSSNLSKP